MDTRRFLTSTSLRPEDLHDGKRTEKIESISEHEKFGCPVAKFESGEQLNLNNFHLRVLHKAWGWESATWIGQTVELEEGTYQDRKTGEDKPTIVLRTVSAPTTGNSKALPPLADDLDDEVPFNI